MTSSLRVMRVLVGTYIETKITKLEKDTVCHRSRPLHRGQTGGKTEREEEGEGEVQEEGEGEGEVQEEGAGEVQEEGEGEVQEEGEGEGELQEEGEQQGKVGDVPLFPVPSHGSP